MLVFYLRSKNNCRLVCAHCSVFTKKILFYISAFASKRIDCTTGDSLLGNKTRCTATKWVRWMWMTLRSRDEHPANDRFTTIRNTWIHFMRTRITSDCDFGKLTKKVRTVVAKRAAAAIVSVLMDWKDCGKWRTTQLESKNTIQVNFWPMRIIYQSPHSFFQIQISDMHVLLGARTRFECAC